SGGLGHAARTIEEGIDGFVEGVPLFVLAALFEVVLDLVEECTNAHGLTLLLDAGEVVPQDRAIFILAGTDIGAQRQVFFVEFQATQFLGHLGVADDQVAQQLSRQDVQRHHGLVVADRHHGARAAIGGGGEVEQLGASELGDEDVQNRVLVNAGTQVMQHFAVIALAQAGHLIVVTTEEGECALCGTTAEHRAGNHPIEAGLELAGGEFLQVGAQTGTQQTRLLDDRAAQRDHALNEQLAGGEQLAYGNHVLIADLPYALAGADRIEEVNVSAGQTGRVRAGEGFTLHLGQLLARQVGAIGIAQEYLGQVAEHLQTIFKISSMFTDDHRRIGGKRVRIDGSHEDRTGHGIERRNFAERTRPQSGPKTRLLQVFANLLATQSFELIGSVLGEGFLLVAIDIDDNGLQDTLLAAVNGADYASSGGGVAHAGCLLVGKQHLTELDPITDLHFHRRLHPVIVEADDGDTTYGPGGLDTLCRRTRYGQIEPML